jgi:hypothetical protein
MTASHSFSTYEILQKIAFWEKEPLSSQALSALIHHFIATEDCPLETKYSYKNDDIESFIIDTLLQITE